MSRFHSYLNTATKILGTYRGDEPFASFLRKYFAVNNKAGSRDRKMIGHFCYCYFRLGKMKVPGEVNDRIILAIFLCENEPTPWLEVLRPEWNVHAQETIEHKLTIAGLPAQGWLDIFPWKNELSDGISHHAFALSHLTQPDLFLRIRPEKEQAVREKLAHAGLNYSITGSTVTLPNGTKLEGTLDPDSEVVIQDLSSQQTSFFMEEVHAAWVSLKGKEKRIDIWDACAASGGKSILAYDIFQHCKLTVTDIRKSILVNLEARFSKAGIRDYTGYVADLFQPGKVEKGLMYDFVIADLPCSGSGTWGRTPEQLFYFDTTTISHYARLQKSILSNIHSHVKPGGYLLYITCSVFREENESAVELLTASGLVNKGARIFTGYENKADTLFAALFHKPLKL